MILQKYNKVIPLLFLALNILFTLFLIEELIDATEPNYGWFSYFTPLIAVISLLFIRKFVENKNIWFKILQFLNWLFILFPILIFVWGLMILANY